MNRKALAIAGLVVILAVPLAVEEEAKAGHRSETSACTGLTDGDVTVDDRPVGSEFFPRCVVIDNGERVTWENKADDRHNPGDIGGGEHFDPLDPECFETNSEVGHDLRPGETYTVQLFFDEEEEKLYRTASWHDGDKLSDGELEDSPLPGPDTACLENVWEYTDDGDSIAIDYACHIHSVGDGGRILIEI